MRTPARPDSAGRGERRCGLRAADGARAGLVAPARGRWRRGTSGRAKEKTLPAVSHRQGPCFFRLGSSCSGLSCSSPLPRSVVRRAVIKTSPGKAPLVVTDRPVGGADGGRTRRAKPGIGRLGRSGYPKFRRRWLLVQDGRPPRRSRCCRSQEVRSPLPLSVKEGADHRREVQRNPSLLLDLDNAARKR